MRYLRWSPLVLFIAAALLLSYEYGRYVETRRVLAYELTVIDLDVLVAGQAKNLIGSDDAKARKVLNDHIELKKASTNVNKRWLNDAGFFNFIFDEYTFKLKGVENHK